MVHKLTESSKSPAVVTKSNKQWVEICLYQEECKLLLINCGVVEYSCAATPQVRQTGNRLSGLAGTAYASLLT